jgi:Protein of unknown function (DUF3306)
MSESENFLARWSRLKRAAAVEASGEPPTLAFDPASLPPIESIDATTDIRAFLEARVPDELKHAALRSTWSADPAIRDFVGIAESQWDFNDPASIPGFGVDAAADCVGSLVVHSVETLSTASVSPGTYSEPADLAPQITPVTTDPSPIANLGAPAGTTSDPGPQMAHSHGGALPRVDG